jgi:tRNA (cytidine/uridine-2'-O-)-methyltransferase
MDMLNIVLYQPEIPPNTGNIIRLCANSGAHLHLVGPLGFALEESRLKRAGLDYRAMATVTVFNSWMSWLEQNEGMRLWACSTRGKRLYSDASFRVGDGLLFGPETRGLPADLLGAMPCDHVVRLPMQADSRSLNLSNTVAVVLYEGLRQLGFPGLN